MCFKLMKIWDIPRLFPPYSLIHVILSDVDYVLLLFDLLISLFLYSLSLYMYMKSKPVRLLAKGLFCFVFKQAKPKLSQWT